MKRVMLAITLLGAVAAYLPAQRGSSAQSIDDFFREFTDEWVRANPNLAASSRYFTGEEQNRLEQQLTPLSYSWQNGRLRQARRGLADLAKFDRTRMTPTQRVSADLLRWQLEITTGGEPYRDYSFPLEQMGGANVGLVNTMTVTHSIASERDAANYVARLGQVAPRMEEAIAEARRLIDKKMIPPRFILRATIAQMQGFIGTAPAQNPLVAAFNDRMAAVKSISEARRAELRAAAEKVTSEQVYPVWKKAIALLEPQVERVNGDAGLWRFKGGAEAYAYTLRRFTTTKLTADEIHQIGLHQVDAIEKQMDALFRRIGRTQGTVKDRIEQLKRDQAYPLTEDGRKQIMAETERILRDAEVRSASLFEIRPKAPVVAQPYPRFREANAAASYSSPAPDGSRPGTFQIPLRPERMTKFGLRSLVYHETVPGHHFQIALQIENRELPRFRQIGAFGGISALTEGWGLYAEKLAAESGWYDNDIEGLLGQLDAELFRARRLVVDTGIHAKHWTRQQAIDYGIEASEVERYVVNPGQACSYMIGQLKIIELREKAKRALGDRFSFQAFHNTVLGTGSVPLDILEQQVDAYIKSAAR
jgi:uncharacterized protein (DUF885 family)